MSELSVAYPRSKVSVKTLTFKGTRKTHFLEGRIEAGFSARHKSAELLGVRFYARISTLDRQMVQGHMRPERREHG